MRRKGLWRLRHSSARNPECYRWRNRGWEVDRPRKACRCQAVRAPSCKIRSTVSGQRRGDKYGQSWLSSFRFTVTAPIRALLIPIRQVSLPRSAHLGEAVANLLGVQRWLLPGGEVAPPVQDVVMDQVWHPPIDPAPRGAVGLARIYADAYGKLQSGRCDVG